MNTTSGVTVTVTCSDTGGSNCSSSNTTGETGVESSTTYTVYDVAGNSGTCSVTVSSYTEEQHRSCDSYYSGPECDCLQHDECENASACGRTKHCSTCGGYYNYGGSCNCICGSNVVGTGACSNSRNDCDSACGGTNWGCDITNTSGACSRTWVAPYDCNCYWTTNSCVNDSCDCVDWDSCPAAGCSDWGSWSSWTTVNSCTTSSSNTFERDCQTKYY